MNTDTPFNPAVPSGLNIPLTGNKSAKAKSPRPKTRRPARPAFERTKTRAKTAARHFTRKLRHEAKASWAQIKTDLQTRLARLDADKLKRVLVACGVGILTVLIILALAKHVILRVRTSHEVAGQNQPPRGA